MGSAAPYQIDIANSLQPNCRRYYSHILAGQSESKKMSPAKAEDLLHGSLKEARKTESRTPHTTSLFLPLLGVTQQHNQGTGRTTLPYADTLPA